MGQIKERWKWRVSRLEAQMELRRRGENELNRRIDKLTELVAEQDKLLDVMRDNGDKSETR